MHCRVDLLNLLNTNAAAISKTSCMATAFSDETIATQRLDEPQFIIIRL
jgi:hypothetical protein